MNKNQEVLMLGEIVQLELSKAQCSDIDGYDRNFRKELIRWLTYSDSRNVRFIDESVAKFDWWDLKRAKVIAATVKEYFSRTIQVRLVGLLNKIEELERSRAEALTR